MQHTATAGTGPAPETRALSGAGPTRHTFQHAAPGATVDVDLCAKCGCGDGGDRHASSARIDEALTVLHDLRRWLLAERGRADVSYDRALVLAYVDGRARQLGDLLNGVSPTPFMIAGHLTGEPSR